MNGNNMQQINDEMDLLDTARQLFKQRGLIFAFSLIFASLGGVYQFSKLTFYAPKAMKYPISVEFSSENGVRYPNGSPFSFQDIIAPENISNALTKTKVQAELEAVSSALSINSSNILLSDTEELLLERLEDKKLAKDQLELTNKVLSDLRGKARTYATLSLDLSKLKLSSADAQKILVNVTSSWAEDSFRKGLVNPNISYPEQPFIYDKKAVIIDNYDKLFLYGSNLKDALFRLRKLDASDTLIVDGQSLNDISRKLEGLLANDVRVMRAYSYSISAALIKDNPLLEVQIFSQILVKNLERDELSKRVKTYENVLSQLAPAHNNVASGTQLSMQGGDSNVQASMDQGILKELLDLGSKVSSSDLRKEIINRQIATSETLYRLEKEIAMIQGTSGQVESSINQKNIIAAMPKIFDDAVKEINELQKTFTAVLVEYRKINANRNIELYSAISDAYVENPLSISLKKTLAILIAGGLLGLFLGVIVALGRSAFSANNRSKEIK